MGKLVRDKLEDPIKSIHMQATSLQNKTEEVADILEVLECLLTLSSLS